MEGDQHSDRRHYDILLERVIKIIEDYQKAQQEYLNELIIIKNRFDFSDRDHSDVKQQLVTVIANTFEVLNRMNKASNDKIIELLEKNEDFNIGMSYKFSGAEGALKSLNDKFSFLSSIDTNVKNIGKSVIETKNDVLIEIKKVSDSFSLIQKLLAAILILVSGVVIASTVWKTIQDQNFSQEVKNLIQQELRK